MQYFFSQNMIVFLTLVISRISFVFLLAKTRKYQETNLI